MIRLAPLITADVDTTTLPGGKASDAAQDFLALLSEALAGETTTDKAAPQLLVATDKPTTKGEPLISDIVSDAQQADLLIPVDETLPVINDEQSTSTPLTTAQTMTLAAVADKNTTKDEKADDLNEDVTASLSALFAMLPGFDNTPKVTDAPSTVLPAEKPTLFTKLTSAQLTTAQPDDAPGTPAQPLTPLVAEAQSKAEVISTPSPVTAAASPLITPHQTQPLPTVAAPVLSAPLGSHEWQQSLSQHISLFTRQGQQSAELRLHPQDLGEVQISLKVDDNQAQIQMISPHQHVRAALEAALPVLRTQLAESGIQLGQSNISGESFSGQQQAASQPYQEPQSTPGIEQQWRTYRIESGKTLAQLFRDHGLPATDVYAMAQVEGAGKPLSNLQNGQMVKIRQNASGVVTGLTIDTGNNQQVLFTRQPDGSFIRAR